MRKQYLFLDMLMLIFLAYLYLWKVHLLSSAWGIISFMYLVLLVLGSYFFLLKVLRLNRFASLVGAVVFAFSGSGLSLVKFSHSIPYPGIIPVVISCICFPRHKKGMPRLYFVTAFLFLLVSISVFMHLPLLISFLGRLFFNACFGAIAAMIVDDMHVVDKVYSFFLEIFLGVLLILLPISYAFLILFLEASKRLLPHIVNVVDGIAIFGLFLGWVLFICRKKAKISLSAAALFFTLFLIIVDIFTYWTAIGCKGR
jgi:hypothetical protein